MVRSDIGMGGAVRQSVHMFILSSSLLITALAITLVL